MKNEYPKYKRWQIAKILKELSPANKQELNSFDTRLLTTNLPEKVVKVNRIMAQVIDVTGLDLNVKPTMEQRDQFLALLNNSDYSDSYKNEIKIYYKKFLRFKWKDLSLLEDFPKLERNGKEKVTEQDLFTDEEIKRLLDAEQDIKWRAILCILLESGCRPDELLNLKYEEISFK